jgi:hypothetical protein
MTLEKTINNLRKTKSSYFNTNIEVVRIQWNWYIKDENFSYSEEKFKCFIKNKCNVFLIDYGFKTLYKIEVNKLLKTIKWINV